MRAPNRKRERSTVSCRLLLLVVFLTISCATNESPTTQDRSPPPQQITFLALGDSYTIGEAVAEDQRWPSQLANALPAGGVEVTDLKVVARTGWTTTDLIAAAAKGQNRFEYDLVTLLIGVNNQFQGLPFEVFETEFAELLDMAINYSAGDTSRVVAVSIPDYGVTPNGALRGAERIRQEIDLYNGRGLEIAEGYGIPYVDITTLSRLAAHDSTLVATDNLHFSGTMYALWVERLLPVVIDAVR